MSSYKRVLIKLSGEALSGTKGYGFDYDIVNSVVKQLKTVVEQGTELAIVIGGGNFWRGRTDNKMDRTKSDQIGMLATVMNSLYVAEVCRANGLNAVVQTPFQIGTITELFSKDSALEHMKNKTVVFFAGGTGHPYFSTDTGAALRGCEIEADVLLFAKNIDGVYDSDPKFNPNAKKFTELTGKDIIEKQLKVIDTAAASLCMDQHLDILIFPLNFENSIIDVISGKNIGTIIKN
ncbi:MAG: UMP kinase [Epulopiscium sp.]|jgi:uridylate kinase|nr:UMP kinase [Candidatus Epulonipiscium sp.]HOQ16486.1 UMP kinase [Defluviitaleaceae bacterium]HPT75262.1 UMP kinase [Defluviitaleaceae bacterium]